MIFSPSQGPRNLCVLNFNDQYWGLKKILVLKNLADPLKNQYERVRFFSVFEPEQ